MTQVASPAGRLTLQPHMRIVLERTVVAANGDKLEAGTEVLAHLTSSTELRLHGAAGVSITASLGEVAGAALAGCICEWADDGTGESGPSPYISEPNPLCPEHGAHTPEWREAEEQQRGYEVSLLLSTLEANARGYEQAAEALSSELEAHKRQALEARAEGIREALELVRTTKAGRALAEEQAEAEASWEQNTESANR